MFKDFIQQNQQSLSLNRTMSLEEENNFLYAIEYSIDWGFGKYISDCEWDLYNTILSKRKRGN